MSANAPPRAPGELAEIEAFIPTPEMIAAAWDAWMPRHKQHVRMGPGPAFREAIQAAFAKMPHPDPRQPEDTSKGSDRA